MKKTTEQFKQEVGYYRIYDCGCLKYEIDVKQI